MTESEIIKSLEWLIFNFPKVEKPENDSDRLCNCINLYCKNAVDELKRQKAEIERLEAEVQKQKERTNDVIRSYVEDEWN